MNTKKKRILIADDDPAIVEVLEILLSEAGYVVDVSQEKKTLQKIHTSHPDLLLLDIWMSGEDGREICNYLKRQPFTKDIPIIIVSANKDTERIAHEVKADDFLEKPFETEELLEKIKRLIK